MSFFPSEPEKQAEFKWPRNNNDTHHGAINSEVECERKARDHVGLGPKSREDSM